MAYPLINTRRMPYDIDGTAVGIRQLDGGTISTVFSNGIAAWLDSTSAGNLNKENRAQSWHVSSWQYAAAFWFVFPEVREVTHMGLLWDPTRVMDFTGHSIQGSTDTTNGMDGTWETATYSIQTGNGADFWRSNIFAISFSKPVKALRIAFTGSASINHIYLNAIHLYGRKAAGQTPDDILFTDTDGNELTSLTDWGDQPEGTTELWWFKLKNASTTKIANAVNLQLNNADFAIALSPDGPWVSVIDITSIAAGSLSSTIYARNKLDPPSLILGPRAARCIVTVGSWT